MSRTIYIASRSNRRAVNELSDFFNDNHFVYDYDLSFNGTRSCGISISGDTHTLLYI